MFFIDVKECRLLMLYAYRGGGRDDPSPESWGIHFTESLDPWKSLARLAGRLGAGVDCQALYLKGSFRLKSWRCCRIESYTLVLNTTMFVPTKNDHQ